MSDGVNKGKQKRTLSLSKTKKRGHLSDGVSAGAGTTPITSFFNCTPPPKLACPLCGQLVTRYRINEHIDMQCQNFQRDNSTASTSTNVVPNTHVSPQTSPEPSSAYKEKDSETKTSPYFKKHNSQQATREITNKSVIRTIELGNISSKLSRKCYNGPQTIQTQDTPVLPVMEKEESCFVSSSQKENLHQSEDVKVDSNEKNVFIAESPVTTDLTSAERNDDEKIGESNSNYPPVSPKLPCLSNKLTKRKKGEPLDGHTSAFRKKTRHESINRHIEETQTNGGAGSADNDDSHPKEEPLLGSYSLKSTHDKRVEVLANNILSESSAGDTTKDTGSQRVPYYLRNFLTVLQAVLDNEDDKALFNHEDLSFIHTFEKLSVMGQKLYVRLFQRKLKWLQVKKLDYEEICGDLGPIAQELVDIGFLQTENDLLDLGDALGLLPASELKVLAKTFHLGGSGTQKQQLVDGLLRLSRQKSLFTSSQSSIGVVILKRAKQLACSCVRLTRGPRAVFSRVLLLFSLTDTMEEEEMAAGGQNQLYTILLVNSGRLAFPEYTVQRSAKLFQDREDLIRYEAAMRALQEVCTAMQTGQWEEALELYTAAKTAWQELRKTYDLSQQDKVPVFLRCFTTGWAYTRMLSRGVEILQRLRRYEAAVEELKSLLAQSEYCPDSRGRWWDRLALNLQQHLKQPEEAICAIRDGLSDPLVRTGHQLSLYQRAVRMKESPSFKKYHRQLRDLPTIEIQDVTHVTIRGQLFPHEGGTGKSVFLMPVNEEGQENANSTIMCSVEELCLAHYRRQGFDQGIHGEGSTFSTLFGLLLWDIIFMDGIPDVFRNPYQTSPLDLFTDCFYGNRKEAIETRVSVLREASEEMLHNMLEEVWTSQEGKVCSLVNWERFSSLQQAQSLVLCLGGAFLGRVITRMALDYRHCRGGLPDLVVWSTSNNTYKLVEVKGPNDRLSQKQQIWLDELQKLGADVEVCHVTAIGARGTCLE